MARDIISRGLDESVEYARAQRVRHVLVVGSPRTEPGELLVLELKQGAAERKVPVAAVLSDPVKYFGELGGQRDA